MGILGGIKTTTRRDTIDPYVAGRGRDATARALDINGRPYEAYTGNRVAPLSQQEQRGYLLARRNVGSYQPYYDRSKTLSDQASANFNPAALTKYQDQYQRNVTNPTLSRLRDRGAKNLGQIAANSNKTSAFGDMVNLKSNAESQLNQGLSDAQSLGNYEGYNYAVNSYTQDQANRAALADRYKNLGNAATALSSADVVRLMQAGGRVRNVGQDQANFDYSQYLEGRGWDQNRLNELVRTLGGIDYNRTTQTTAPSGNQTAGALGAGAAALGGYLSQQNPSWGDKNLAQDNPPSNYYQPGGGYDTNQGASEFYQPYNPGGS